MHIGTTAHKERVLYATYENEHLFGVYTSDKLFAHSRFPVCLQRKTKSLYNQLYYVNRQSVL